MWGGGMDMQLAESAAEFEMLVLADVLVAEEDHRVFGECAVNFLESLVTERLRQIDAPYLRADDRGELIDSDGVVGRRFIGGMLVARAAVTTQAGHGRLSQSDHGDRTHLDQIVRMCELADFDKRRGRWRCGEILAEIGRASCRERV